MKKIKEFLNKSTTEAKILILVTVSVILLASYGIWTEYNSGEINIAVPYQGSSIFLDGKKISTTNSNNQNIVLNRVSPGEHSVLVYAYNRYPWEKTVYVKKGEASKLYPFLMLTELNKETSNVTTKLTDDKISKIKPLFEEQSKNTFTSLSYDGNVEIKKEDNSILATRLNDDTKTYDLFCDNDKKCKETINVFTPKTGKIKAMDFYPKREDVVIFTLDNGIYAIELNKNGTQNFQPIYTGDNPSFAIDDQNSLIYIKDGDLVFGVNL